LQLTWQCSIPSIKEKVQKRTEDVDQQLRDCPDLPESDMLNIVSRLLAQVTNDVQNLVNGDLFNDVTSFQKDWTTLCNQFRDLILHIKPRVTVSHESDHVTEVIELISDDDEPSQPSTPRKRPSPGNEQSQSAQRQRMSQSPHSQHRVIQTPPNGMKRENGLMQAPPLPSRGPNFRRNPFSGTPFQSVEHLGKGFTTLTEISKTIISHTRPGVPGLVNIKTFNDLSLMSVAPWKFPLEIFINETLRMLRLQLENILKKRLGFYEQTQLYRAAGTYLEKFLDTHVEEQRKCLKELFELETHRMFTVNSTAISENKENELRGLQATRRNVRAKAYVDKQIRLGREKRISPELSLEEKNKELAARAGKVKDEQLGPDPLTLELGVAAHVRGYYMTAAVRFIDSVCLSVHGKLFRNIERDIFHYLESELGIVGSADGKEFSLCNESIANKVK
jgi:hypothetical protein